MERNEKWDAILLFGAPGSGKGTQGKALGSVPGYLHIACGEIFRQLSKLGQLGKEVAKYTSQGKLVPDDLTISIFRNHMNVMRRAGQFDPERQFLILDGIPRTFRQAELLEGVLHVHRIFSLKLRHEEEAIQRIKARALKENRIDDADEGVIRGRLAVFHQQTADTLRYYPPELVVEIDASNRPMQVLAQLSQQICELVRRPVAAASSAS